LKKKALPSKGPGKQIEKIHQVQTNSNWVYRVLPFNIIKSISYNWAAKLLPPFLTFFFP